MIWQQHRECDCCSQQCDCAVPTKEHICDMEVTTIYMWPSFLYVSRSKSTKDIWNHLCLGTHICHRHIYHILMLHSWFSWIHHNGLLGADFVLHLLRTFGSMLLSVDAQEEHAAQKQKLCFHGKKLVCKRDCPHPGVPTCSRCEAWGPWRGRRPEWHTSLSSSRIWGFGSGKRMHVWMLP